ncbi:MAG: GTPase Era [Eubacteriales bacterium]
MEENFKSAFIGIVGSPNVGKSTMLNFFIGRKVAIVSNKAQTTRSRITGILTKGDSQMIFLDTPGIADPKNMLGEVMVKTAYDSARDVDAALFVADLKHGIGKRDEEILQRLIRSNVPLIVALNKADAVDKHAITKSIEVLNSIGIENDIHTISAITGEGMDELMVTLKRFLVPGPMYYPKSMTSDQPEKQIVAEIIREKTLILLSDEVPHGVGVEVISISEREDKPLIDIEANIYCERDSHKGIIIGKGGSMLKKIGMDARRDIQMLFGKQVFLSLFVKVKENWRDSRRDLTDLGFFE